MHRRIAAAAVAVGLLTCLAAPAEAGPGLPLFEQRVVDLTNAQRQEAGCDDLDPDPALTAAALAHALDMAAGEFVGHRGPDGSRPDDRITAAGYDWAAFGENVAAGADTPERVVAGWMRSPGHRANILDCSFRDIGVGFVPVPVGRFDTYWVQAFGTPAS